jgi:hypothetical protein
MPIKSANIRLNIGGKIRRLAKKKPIFFFPDVLRDFFGLSPALSVSKIRIHEIKNSLSNIG